MIDLQSSPTVNNDYNRARPRLHTSQSAEYMPLLTKNRIDDDIYADPQHDVSDDDDSPVEAYAVVNVHTINQKSSMRLCVCVCVCVCVLF